MDRSEIVRRAFEVFRADVEVPPPLTLRGGDRVDSYDFPEPYDAQLDEATDAYIEQFAFHAMPFLDAQSWRHYLPRIMDHVFRRPDEPTGLVVQALIRSLRAPDREPPRLATLNAEQETVIVAFLTEIAHDAVYNGNAEDAEQALAEWWVPNARHRPTAEEIQARRTAPVDWHAVSSGTCTFSLPTTFTSRGVHEVPTESRRVQIWSGYLGGDAPVRVLVHFEALGARTISSAARAMNLALIRSDGEPVPLKLRGAKGAYRLSGLMHGYSHSPAELERAIILVAQVNSELMTFRVASWQRDDISNAIERIAASVRLT